ncbi:hypothetical protein E2562_001452 [Oryza meyeriana var. granulata]|uniref:Uncharacterized protein n=1 Tax=Oryza meyeriana var. granulata TaxID=110450 RepID=A0A6G1DCW5_9ORYZ|nr:hypothetical protein E2562_001452 [Oryza meyeriana var. granulata]
MARLIAGQQPIYTKEKKKATRHARPCGDSASRLLRARRDSAIQRSGRPAPSRVPRAHTPSAASPRQHNRSASATRCKQQVCIELSSEVRDMATLERELGLYIDNGTTIDNGGEPATSPA